MELRRLKRLQQHGSDLDFLQITDTKLGFRIYIKNRQFERGTSITLTLEQADQIAEYITKRTNLIRATVTKNLERAKNED